MIHSAVVLALTMAAAGLSTRAASQDLGPICRGTLRGKHFTTTYDLPNGYHLEGLWTFTFGGSQPDVLPAGTVNAGVLLGTLFESDSAAAMPREIPLGVPWQMEIAGRDVLDAVDQVVDLWCTTIQRARSQGVRFGRAPAPNRGRIT